MAPCPPPSDADPHPLHCAQLLKEPMGYGMTELAGRERPDFMRVAKELVAMLQQVRAMAVRL